VASEGASLQIRPGKAIEAGRRPPASLAPDPSPSPIDPTQVQVAACRIPTDDVDVYDKCSRPIPILTVDPSGRPVASIAMSISSGLRIPGAPRRNQVLRFDLAGQQAAVVLAHDRAITLLDHHAPSGQTLVLVGFNALGRGGQLAVARGWQQDRLRLGGHRTLAEDDSVAGPSRLEWARWVDRQHVIARIGPSLGLWNLVSGQQIYRIEGIDSRSRPAISAGRRYVAVPAEGGVHLLATGTGRTLGWIDAGKPVVPAVSFSPLGHALAIVTSRQLRTWDLQDAAVATEVSSRRGLGSDPPVWIDSDLVLSSSGVLMSLFRGIPVWRYDLAATDSMPVGSQVAMFRRHPVSELTVLALPHRAATDAMYWIDHSPTRIDTQSWQIPGRSVWEAKGWNDRDVQISAAHARLR
jgi:hypothetical protein